jgi:hypothetical protein
MTELEVKPVADVWATENNCVIAVYVASSELIRQEPPELWAVPFIFYVGTTRHHAVADLEERGVHFGTGAEHDALMEMAVSRGRCDHEEVAKMIPTMWGCYVPYSFGVGHEGDVSRRHRVRTRVEYDRFMVLLKQVHAERIEAAARTAAHDAKLSVRFANWLREFLPRTAT